jgi:glycosyltransferase involved in cell wall biosynthesis
MIIMIVGIVGYRFDHYSYTRNIIGIVPGVEYLRAKDIFAWVNAGARTLNRLTNRKIISTFDLNNQFYDFNLNRVDLMHLFNGISYGGTPWVSTFETILPRFTSVVQRTHGSSPGFVSKWVLHRAFEALAGNSCKQIIAMSDCAANMQRELLVEFSSYKEIIEKKLLAMLPPQDLLVSQFSDKQIDLQGQIIFMFVGNEFFRKGGREIIETLKMLRDRYHYDIELTIVSSLRIDSYAVTVNNEDVQRTEAFFQENRDWIRYFPQLPNSQVLDMMKHAHIGLLPTYADSFGYSVLEFQGSGCPVISTNVRALPEINDNDKGWIIEVPKNRMGEAIYTTESDRTVISEAIRKGLEKVVHEIFANRSIIPIKSAQSILSIKLNHSKEEFSSRMKTIYLNALS